MKLTIESDEGAREVKEFKSCVGCPFCYSKKFGYELHCWSNGNTICDDEHIPDNCPFKKKEKKIKICCGCMRDNQRYGLIQIDGKGNPFMEFESVVVGIWNCPWCGKKIELE